MGAVGVLGMGYFLPPEIRTNDWWPQATVDRWQDRSAHRGTNPEAPTSLSAGARRTLEAFEAYADDPFRGARERRIMPSDMSAVDMETAAAREAIMRADVTLDSIDAVLVQTPVPDQLMVNQAAVTHGVLGLRRDCVALSTQAASNGFAMHATLARSMILSGAARHVLSIHSSAITRLLDAEQPDSAWWGDGAAAAVFGPVSAGRGLLAATHDVDSANSDALVLGVPGKPWWEDGAITTYPANRAHTGAMLLSLVDRARDAIHRALAEAGLLPSDVDFYASHQGTAWLAEVTRRHSGLELARTVTTFSSAGNMSSACVPYVLALGEREESIPEGAVVATFGGGLGETWSSLVFRWGR
ncbi:3-oxoacyl-ACP synthase III family protein [Kribbella deserti]|uniref:3-oxoacyl-ACP synthase III family protein n=1 Tax=Kribbella deserti TaxID=1926257 RepID=A0ABV6QN36_9ACTN